MGSSPPRRRSIAACASASIRRSAVCSARGGRLTHSAIFTPVSEIGNDNEWVLCVCVERRARRPQTSHPMVRRIELEARMAAWYRARFDDGCQVSSSTSSRRFLSPWAGMRVPFFHRFLAPTLPCLPGFVPPSCHACDWPPTSSRKARHSFAWGRNGSRPEADALYDGLYARPASAQSHTTGSRRRAGPTARSALRDQHAIDPGVDVNGTDGFPTIHHPW